MMNTATLFLTSILSSLVASQEPPANEPIPVDPIEETQEVAPSVADEGPALLQDQNALREARAALQAASVARADAWFAELDTLQARFLQYSSNGTEIGGDIALDRPGRVRIDYDDPSPILMVADGTTVALADFELETIDRVPLSATPLRYVLGQDALDATDAVTEVNRADDRIYITLVDPEGETEGRLTLVFHDPEPEAAATSMMLEGWLAIDVMGGLTEVRLSEATLNERLEPRLFILDDEDVIGSDRRRGRR